QNIVGICDEPELRLGGTRAATLDACGPVHLTSRKPRSPGRVAHDSERRVCVTQIVRVRKENSLWLSKARWRSLVQPVAGLDIVFSRIRRAAATGGPERGRTQTLKQIVRRAVLLNNHDHVLEVRDLGLGYNRASANDQHDI